MQDCVSFEDEGPQQQVVGIQALHQEHALKMLKLTLLNLDPCQLFQTFCIDFFVSEKYSEVIFSPSRICSEKVLNWLVFNSCRNILDRLKIKVHQHFLYI